MAWRKDVHRVESSRPQMTVPPFPPRSKSLRDVVIAVIAVIAVVIVAAAIKRFG
jgi:hypothetical protein